MVKRFLLGMVSFGLALGLLTSSVWAFECPGLIQEANAAMAKIKGDEARLAKSKALVAEAEKLHNTGDHDAAIEKANEALTLLMAKGGTERPARKGSSRY